MIYTSFFRNTKQIKNLRQVSIALYPPKKFKGELLIDTPFSKLIPEKELLYDYKYHALSNAKYAIRYIQQIIDINFEMLYREYDNSVFLCFEGRTEFCHRKVLSFFMKKYHNLILTEL